MSNAATYRRMMKQLKASGLNASMMRPAQLVFGVEGGKSAWLTIHADTIILGTWAPQLYRVPGEIDLADLCRTFINSPGGMARVSKEHILRFNLDEISDDESAVILGSNGRN